MQWKVQHKAFVNQRKLSNLCLYRKARRRKKRKADKKKTGKSRKTRQRTFMTLFLSYKKGGRTDAQIDTHGWQEEELLLKQFALKENNAIIHNERNGTTGR